MDWVDKQPTSGLIFLFVLILTASSLYTRTHLTEELEVPRNECEIFMSVKLRRISFTHFLRELVRIEDSWDRHLELVFLLLSLTQSRFPLLQKQIC